LFFFSCWATGGYKITVLEDTFLNSSIGIGEGALPVLFAIPNFTDIFFPIGKGDSALSVGFAIPEFTDVFVTFELVVC